MVAVSVAVSFLLLPKPPSQFSQDGAGSVYSVTAQANKAKLGGIIPEQFGRFTRTPEYASQSYRVFSGNDEIRYFLLALGGGDMEVNGVRLGDSPAGDNVTWSVYKPVDHASTIGVIDADFDIHEDVVTSGEVENLDLDTVQKLSDTINASAASGGNKLIINTTDFGYSSVDPGDTLIIEDTVIAGTYEVDSVLSGSWIQITGTFPANISDSNMRIVIKGGESIERGPFIVNASGTDTDTIELDIEFPQGIYKQKDNGSFGSLTVSLLATVQEIDDSGADVGSTTAHAFSFTRASNKYIRETVSISKASGRYKVSLKRTDDQNLGAGDGNRTIWSGLKAYLNYDTGTPAYGDVTIMAIKITSAQESSESSKQRIFVDSSRVIHQLGTTTDDDTGNLADVMAHIITDGGNQPATSYVSSVFSSFRTEQSTRAGFNGVFDTPTTIWSALQDVALLGRAKPYPVGSQVSLVLDRAKTRSRVATPSNIISGSANFQLNMFDPAANDGVEVEYRDFLTGQPYYKLWPTGSLDPQRVAPIGLTDEDEALSLAKYVWRQKTLRSISIEWTTERDGRNYQPFDVVGVVMPDFDWADAARVKASSGTSITLHKPAPSGALSVQFQEQDGTLSAVVGATGDGSKTIVLDASPPITMVHDGLSEPTVCVFGLTSSFSVEDALIQRVIPSGNNTRIEAVTMMPLYLRILFDG